MKNIFSLNLASWAVIVALILSIVATVLAFVFIVPEKRRRGLNKFGKFLHDTCNFKYLVIEKILQALYIFLTVYIIICGFFMLFYVEKEVHHGYSWYSDYATTYTTSEWRGWIGLLMIVFGPIAVRLFYELCMMAVLLVKNVISINNKLKNQNEENANNDPFSVPEFSVSNNQNYYQPQNVTAQNVKYCPSCGTVVESGSFCPRCGTKVD